MKRILAIFVVLLLLLSGCKPSVPPLAEGLDSPILQDVERIPKVIPRERTPYEGDVADIPNGDALQFLGAFGLSLKGVDTAVQMRDNHSRNVYELESKDAIFVFDENGNLVRLSLYNPSLPYDETTFAYQTQADVQDLLDRVVEVVDIPDNYQLEFRNDEGYCLQAIWYKKERDGTLNRYDRYSITINAADGSLNEYSQQVGLYERNATEPLVTKEQAIAFAGLTEKVASGDVVVSEPTLGYVRPNFQWEEGGPYEDAPFIRLAWSMVTSYPEDHEYFPGKETSIIYIDARTGEELGGHAYR